MAAMMSINAAALNSISTLLSFDVYKRMKREIPDKKRIRIGKIVALCIVVIAALQSTLGSKFSSVFEANNKVAPALSPPVTMVLLLGVLYKKDTRDVSFLTHLFGLVLGITVFALEFKVTPAETSIVAQSWGIPFMMQVWWLFVFVWPFI